MVVCVYLRHFTVLLCDHGCVCLCVFGGGGGQGVIITFRYLLHLIFLVCPCVERQCSFFFELISFDLVDVTRVVRW